MGVLNLTPDSFSDGGKYNEINLALKRVEYMIESGADIIDIGAESSRPGAEIITVDDERERLEPTLKEIKKVYDFSAMVPLQLENSIEHLHYIKTIIVGGAKVSKGLISKLVNSTSTIYETFGMTETVSHIAVKNISISKDVFEVLPSVSIGVDTRNCLFIKAPHIVSALIQTNDVVNLTSKTTFEWVGRYDAVINSGGIKISPEQLELQLEGLIQQRFFIASQKISISFIFFF